MAAPILSPEGSEKSSRDVIPLREAGSRAEPGAVHAGGCVPIKVGAGRDLASRAAVDFTAASPCPAAQEPCTESPASCRRSQQPAGAPAKGQIASPLQQADRATQHSTTHSAPCSLVKGQLPEALEVDRVD